MRTINLTREKGVRVLDVKVGEEFVVELDENPTTGYCWELEKGSPAALVSLGDNYRSGDSPAAGAAGVRQFRFRSEAPGEYHLSFTLRRAWETSAFGSQQVGVTIKVS